MKPKISIIVPVYNTENKLPRCIDSILAQSFTYFELLLIDDGSKDESGNVCDEYAQRDKRIRVVHTKNGGVSSARNIGLNAATGEWITFCDSDDELLPKALETFLSYSSDCVDLVKTGYEIVDEKEKVLDTLSCTNTSFISNREDMLRQCELSKYFGFLWNSFIKRDIIGNLRFDKSISWCEDHIFIYSVMNRVNNMAIVSQCTYRYYVDSTVETNLSAKFHEPSSIVHAAKLEREAKYKLWSSDEKLKSMIDSSYEAKICKAAVDSFHLNGFIKTLLLIRKEASMPFQCFKYSFKQYIKSKKLVRYLSKFK